MAKKKAGTEQDLDRVSVERLAKKLGRESLLAMTAYVDPAYIFNWHHCMMGRYLDKFARGKIKRLIFSTPPRMGKSDLFSVKTPAYILGTAPSTRILAASHTDPLAKFFNRKIQRLIQSPAYRELFPEIGLKSLPPENYMGSGMEWVQRDTEFDLVGYGENYRCAGVERGFTGKGGDRLFIDDPIKTRKEAESQGKRDDLWEFYLDDIESRDDGGAGIAITATRWHDDDLIGRLTKTNRGSVVSPGDDDSDDSSQDDKWVVVNLPAILEDESQRHVDPENGERDPRQIGQTLWPWRWAGRNSALTEEEAEAKALAKLRRRQAINPYGFAALYQGSPNLRVGNLLKPEKMEVVKTVPGKLVRVVRYWDKAATQDGGKRTAGVKLGLLDSGKFIFLHVIKGQWGVGRREEIILDTARSDGTHVEIGIEQEPGSGGLESYQASATRLAGFKVKADRPTGDKFVRAEPLATQIEIGNVYMLEGDWNQGFKDEFRVFGPRATFKDQVDGASGAFSMINSKNTSGDFDNLIKD
jgi:predicted phage terminase large subunit-like protein